MSRRLKAILPKVQGCTYVKMDQYEGMFRLHLDFYAASNATVSSQIWSQWIKKISVCKPTIARSI
jgi:hypothetical protein